MVEFKIIPARHNLSTKILKSTVFPPFAMQWQTIGCTYAMFVTRFHVLIQLYSIHFGINGVYFTNFIQINNSIYREDTLDSGFIPTNMCHRIDSVCQLCASCHTDLANQCLKPLSHTSNTNGLIPNLM
jgi:hypothetical protein